MISPWEVYLFTRLDVLNAILFFFSLILCVWFIGCCMQKGDVEGETEKARWGSLRNRVGVAFVFTVVAFGAIPTTKEAAVIYLLPKIANNEQVQKVPENFVKLLNTKMEAWIADFEKEKKK